MPGILSRFATWLHLRWPAGRVEPLPVVGEHGRTRIPGVHVVGDLSGIPLLKMSLESGVQAVRALEPGLATRQGETDVVIIGGGVAGVAAAIECSQRGLSYQLLEANQLFSTIANFPRGKPIFTYPTGMRPSSALSVSATVKEDLLAELQAQAEAHRVHARACRATHIARQGGRLLVHLAEGEAISCKGVIVAIGRSGDFRRLGIPGEELDKVTNRLHDPAAFAGKRVLVVGGGDTACEAAIAIAEADGDGTSVTLAYRGRELSRPKPDNVRRVRELADAGRLDLALDSLPIRITAAEVTLRQGEEQRTIANDQVLSLIGREAPLGFFRRSGIPIHGERSPGVWAGLLGFLLLISVLYGMKSFGWFSAATWNPVNWAGAARQQMLEEGAGKGLGYTLLASASNGFGFWIALLYCSVVVVFGIRRIRRRKTPYVTLQTLTLMAIQCLPLFILPEILLPWAGHAGAFDDGWGAIVADHLFPVAAYDHNGREYWRAYGFILAWPLFVWNLFTGAPNSWWLVISLVQTFVIIPLLVWRWGKGSYCGWICSCGAMAETLGDTHREKMPHGPFWNRLNLIGQVLLLAAFALLAIHVVSWLTDWSWAGTLASLGLGTGWKPVVDWLLAGALGMGLYFAWSGRVWCRFACPLAALMHIYARFSRFRIVVEQKKCISCNACTSVCHQGIDIMNFANKGEHMADPQCVRCSACVQTCPTGVLQFGRVDGREQVIAVDRIAASPVLMREAGDGPTNPR